MLTACVMGLGSSLLYLAPALIMVGMVGFVHLRNKIQMRNGGGPVAQVTVPDSDAQLFAEYDEADAGVFDLVA